MFLCEMGYFDEWESHKISWENYDKATAKLMLVNKGIIEIIESPMLTYTQYCKFMKIDVELPVEIVKKLDDIVKSHNSEEMNSERFMKYYGKVKELLG
jgi:hypothetical protein